MADIKASEGLTEDEIVRAAVRISFSLSGEELVDLAAMYGDQPNVNLALVLSAAKTYLLISERHYIEA